MLGDRTRQRIFNWDRRPVYRSPLDRSKTSSERAHGTTFACGNIACGRFVAERTEFSLDRNLHETISSSPQLTSLWRRPVSPDAASRFFYGKFRRLHIIRPAPRQLFRHDQSIHLTE